MDRPNIVLVLADDLGWGDLDSPGIRRPHLDRLAAGGRRFNDFYVAQAVCSASRAAWLTGCYPNRIGIDGALPDASPVGLSSSETTLAELCQERGYGTALFGKWHLGDAPEFSPLEHGFDEFYGLLGPHRERPGPGEMSFDALNTTEPLTRELTERAVAFIERQAVLERPFFLMLAHPMPRVPLKASAAFQGSSSVGLYGDVLQELDASVGALQAALQRSGLLRHTLFIFSSDNGPWLSYGDHAGSTGGLRGGKGSSFEGGVRVPCLMSWPGVISPGSECQRPLMSIDLLPSLAAWIGAAPPALAIDGRDRRGLMSGSGAGELEDLPYFFWNQGNRLEAMRLGRWKLHFPHGFRSVVPGEAGRGGEPGRYRYGQRIKLSLFDLAIDPGELRDVGQDYPEVLRQLQALADAKRLELGDKAVGQAGRARRPPGRVGEPGPVLSSR